MIEHSPTIAELCKALHGAQGEMTGVVKDAKNPHFKNRYATLESVLDTTRPALQANGLSVSQAPGQLVDGAVEITTMLMHSSGEWMRSTLHMPVVKRDPQGVGSAITYGLRYALMAVLGVPPTDDDDGERAMPDRAAPRGSNAPALHTNGRPIELTASQRACEDASAALWKVSGKDVESVVRGQDFIGLWQVMDPPERERVKALVAERKALTQ